MQWPPVLWCFTKEVRLPCYLFFPPMLFWMRTVCHPWTTFQILCFETQLTPNYKSKSNYLDSHYEFKIIVWCLFIKNNTNQANNLLKMQHVLSLIWSNNNSHIPCDSSSCSFSSSAVWIQMFSFDIDFSSKFCTFLALCILEMKGEKENYESQTIL